MANYQRERPSKRKYEYDDNDFSSSNHSSQQTRHEKDSGPNKSIKHSRTATPNNRIVADHYNSKVDTGVQRRRESTIIFLRSFNNWIKSILIGRYTAKDGYALDLGCGKGGDLLKWNKANIKKFVGLGK